MRLAVLTVEVVGKTPQDARETTQLVTDRLQASVLELRLTPERTHSSGSGGSREPGCSRPDVISSRSSRSAPVSSRPEGPPSRGVKGFVEDAALRISVGGSPLSPVYDLELVEYDERSDEDRVFTAGGFKGLDSAALRDTVEEFFGADPRDSSDQTVFTEAQAPHSARANALIARATGSTTTPATPNAICIANMTSCASHCSPSPVGTRSP